MMKLLTLGVVICICLLTGCNRDTETPTAAESKQDSTSVKTGFTDQVVELSCGQCQLAMTGGGHCDLAVRIDGNSYFVDGSSIDDHGDAHGDEGLCNCIRSAKVSGEIKDGRFVATAVEVLPISE